MDAAERRRWTPGDQHWDHHSHVYIQTTHKSCRHVHPKPGADPPYMQETIEDVHSYRGETAKFDALIDGSPPLTIVWYKDQKLLKESDRIQTLREERRFSLIIRHTEAADGGVYTCVARNSAGEVSCKAELVMVADESEQETKPQPRRRKLKSFFEVKEEIGRGSFGFVKRVVHKGNGATCAAKFIPLRSKTRQQAYRERDILSEVSHDRVTLLLDAFETKKTLILIMEICCGEELLDRLFRKRTITEKEVKIYIRQLLEAIAYLHDKNILHLDIKPSNILMLHPDQDDIKLCDFGSAQKIISSDFQYSKYGSPEFVAPEIASQAPVSTASDIWPVGVICYLCLVSASPFAGQNDRETLLNVQQGKMNWSAAGFTPLSDRAKHFIMATVHVSPDARPSASDCIRHQWFMMSSGPDENRPISSKNLRFLVARSRWQRSLMSYKSILVMRPIPELLNGKLESTSLGVPRHLVECSSSSTSSGSSSDNESDVSPTARDRNPSLELYLSIFKMSEKEMLQKSPESGGGREDKDVSEDKKMESPDPSPMAEPKCEHDHVLGMTDSPKEPEEEDKMSVHPVETSPRRQHICRSATIEVGGLPAKKPKTGSFIRGTSADSALLLQGAAEKPSSVCVPRQSIIKSTFYNQDSEGSAIAPLDDLLKDKDYIRHRERARRSLIKAGYSPKILSGLREPLLEQFAMEQRMMSDQDGPLGALKKSASFDTAKGAFKSSFKVSSRSRSLDDYKSRSLSVYKGTVVEEGDQEQLSLKKMDPDTKLLPEDSAPPEGHSAPVKVSSTQRPLSAPPTGRDSTIIAVFHQHPILESTRRPSSVPPQVEESTIITFVRPRQTSESTEMKDLKVPPLSPQPGIKEDAPPLDIQGGVMFTIHSRSEGNDFLVSATSPKKDKCPEHFSEDKIRTEGSEDSPDDTLFQLVELGPENNTVMAVIHQGTSEEPMEEHDRSPEEMADPEPPQEETARESSDRTTLPGKTMAESTEGKPDDGDQTQPSISQTPDLQEDHREEMSPPETLQTPQIDNNGVPPPPDNSGVPPPPDNSQVSPPPDDSGVSPPPDNSQVSPPPDNSQVSPPPDDSLVSPQADGRHIVYSDGHSLTLEDLVGEMSSLSDEMDVLAGEEKPLGEETPPFPPVIAPELQDVGHYTSEVPAMETDPSPMEQILKESQVMSVSQCSFYESLSRAEVSTVESRSSSKTFFSHSDSSGTGRRSDNFSDFDEAGRHSEVSLVEISGLHLQKASTSPALPRSDVGAARSQLQDFYHIFASPWTSLTPEEPKFNLSPTGCGDATMETTSVGEDTSSGPPLRSPLAPELHQTKDKKRKRIKLFRPNGKSEKTVKTAETSLRQKVKASVANISRIIKRRPGNGKEGPSEMVKVPVVEPEAAGKVSGSVKRKVLPTFRLPNLSGKDKAPAFVEELTDQTVVVGHMVTLSCRTAQPVTDVEWYKDGVLLRGSERLLISSTLKNYHLLTILVVTTHDLGIYACVATNVLGTASTCCIIKKAEIPCCPSSPEVAQVYKDGALIVWKPVESGSPVTYFLQYRREGEEWRALTLDVSDCCYSTHSLCEGHAYSFRVACISKAGMGPYSEASAAVRIGRRSPANVQLPGAAEPPDSSGFIADLQIEGRRGRFSSVRLCTEKSTGRAFVAKVVPYTEETKEAALREYQMLKTLHHTNVVQLHAAYLSPQDLVLILERCEGRQLLHCLSAGPSYSELEVRDYLWQVLSAVEFLHDKQILHLDLRSENMVLTEHRQLKVLDFGNAQYYSPEKVIAPPRYTDYPETTAPELLEGQGAAPPTDIWAVGITAFIMLSADLPFSQESDIQKGLVRFSRCYAGLSGGAVRFLQSTLWANPWGRPSASDCLKMPWLQEAGLAALEEPPVLFDCAKLRSFLRERRKREAAVTQKSQ